jgi:5-methyltetrahydrofolate--homocysteine methyltransferase
LKLQGNVKKAEDIIFSNSYISANAIYKFFRAASEGDDVVILDSEGRKVIERFRFGRQSSGDGLCLSDYLFSRDSGKPDYIGMFVTTIGPDVRTLADKLKAEGNYLASHIVQVLALEGAEAFAELLHQKMRNMWGFSDSEGISNKDMFQARYQGKRYSFGYPACPRLEDQGQLWNLLEPDQHINVDLTDGFMMDPEGSVSALVFHHPEAKYFNLSSEDIKLLELRLNSNKSNV